MNRPSWIETVLGGDFGEFVRIGIGIARVLFATADRIWGGVP